MKQGRLILVAGLVVLCVLWRQAQAQQVVYAIKPQPPSCPAVSDYGSNGLNFCYDGTLYFWNGLAWQQVVSGSGTYPSGSPPQITGYSAANTPEAETVSGDCTFTRTGANAYKLTCTTAGGGTGNFQAGSLGVGFAPDGTSGDILAIGGMELGASSLGSGAPGSGNLLIDNFLSCNNASSTSVDCVRANNGLATSSLISITALNAFQFGSSTGPAIAFVASSSGSFNFTIGTTNLMTGTSSGLSVGSGLAGGLRLTNGSLLSITGGTRPTVSCGGVAGTVAIGGTDNKGVITTPASAQTTCTLTFNHAWPQAPVCNCFDHQNVTGSTIVCSSGTETTTTFPFSFTASSNYKFGYLCF